MSHPFMLADGLVIVAAVTFAIGAVFLDSVGYLSAIEAIAVAWMGAFAVLIIVDVAWNRLSDEPKKRQTP